MTLAPHHRPATATTPAIVPLPAHAPRRVALHWLTATVLALTAGIAAAQGPAVTDADAVSLDEARAQHEAGKIVLIDVREPDEHATGVARGARLLPMSQLKARLAEVPTDASRPVYLVCRTQNRSAATLKALRQLPGYAHVRYVRGGMSEWAQRGWPLARP